MEEINKITVNGVEHEVADASSRITLSALVQSFAELSGSKQDALTQGKGIIISENNEISVDDNVLIKDNNGYIAGYTYFGDITVKNTAYMSYISSQGAVFGRDILIVNCSYAYNKVFYNGYEIVNENSYRLLPEHYLTAYDGLLYMDRGCESIVPVSHPDYSTQPSILPQRFGDKDVYEVMIPLERKDINHIDSIGQEDFGNNHLHYLKYFLNRAHGRLPYRFTMTTKQSQDFYLHSNDLEIYTESFGDCLIIMLISTVYLIDPNNNSIYNLSNDEYILLDTLLDALDYNKVPVSCMIIPAKIHSLDTSHEYHPHWHFINTSGDVYVCHSNINKYVTLSSAKQLFYHFSDMINNKMPDYNVNNIPNFDHFEALNDIANGTIIDAKLFNAHGAMSPCCVFSHKNDKNSYSASICIKEVIPSSVDYDWCMIQYAITCYGAAYYDKWGGGDIEVDLLKNAFYFGGEDLSYMYVDMGTNCDWAVCNLGSSYVYNIGKTFAWSDNTRSKSEIELIPVSYYHKYSKDGNAGGVFTKYNSDDHKNILDEIDDPAYRTYDLDENIKKIPRTPTAEDFRELLKVSDIKEITYEGTQGHLFISKKTGNQLFLPFSYVADKKLPYYWTSSCDINAPKLSYSSYYYGYFGDRYGVNNAYYNDYSASRYSYLAIRPVLQPLVDNDNLYNGGGYNFLDILWNDGQITADLREEDAEKDPDLAPVAICVIPTDYLGEGEKARFMSLLHVDKSAEGTGSVNPVTMNWGPNSPSSDDPLADMYTMNICKDVTNPSTNVQGGGSFTWTSTSNTWPDLRYNEDVTAWKDAQQYLEGDKYVMADINGKSNTKRIWEALDFADNTNYAFVNLNNFKPNVHAVHDIKFKWYIPAAGELLNMLFNTGYDKYTANGNKVPEGSLCHRMQQISEKYPGKSATSVGFSYNYWSSSPMSATGAANFSAGNIYCGGGGGSRTSGYILPFVQC